MNVTTILGGCVFTLLKYSQYFRYKKRFQHQVPMIPDPDAAIPDPQNMQKPRNICIHICNTLVQQWHFISLIYKHAKTSLHLYPFCYTLQQSHFISLIYELMRRCFEFSSKSGENSFFLSNSFIPQFPLIRNRSEKLPSLSPSITSALDRSIIAPESWRP